MNLKKTKFKSFILGMLVMFIFMSGVNTTLAKSVKEKIDVLYKDIKIYLDGKEVKLGKDSKGQQIEPFIYNGTTYLPVRAIGETFGKEVGWDGEKNHVYLGTFQGVSNKTNFLTDNFMPKSNNDVEIVQTSTNKFFSVANVDKENALIFNTPNSYIEYDLEGKYNTLIGELSSYKEINNKLEVYLDGNYYGEIESELKDGVTVFSIPVKEVHTIKLVRPENTKESLDYKLNTFLLRVE